MGRAPAMKPAGAKKSMELPGWVLKCGAGVLILGVIIGVSHVLSPSEANAPAAAAPAAKKKAAGSAHVTALDDSNWDAFMAANPDGVLVDFYSKDCKFCTKLAPEYEAAAKELSGSVPLASVENIAGPEIMKKFDINRYPTVLWFNKGENVLELARVSEKPAAKIVEWAKWAITPAVQELETRAEFEEALGTLRGSLHAKARLMVAFSKAGADGMRAAFEAAAQRHRTTTIFLYIKEASGDTLLKSLAQEEANDEYYQGAPTPADVTEWVKGVLEKAKPPPAEPAAEKSAADKALEQLQAAQQVKEE